MSDLEQRLRADHPILSRGSEIQGEVLPCNLASEAADRLRQYREALERIEQLTMSQFASVSDLANEAQDLARTTLKETTDV